MDSAPETHRPFYMIFSSRALLSISELIEEYYDKVRENYPKSVLKKFCLMVPDKFKNHQTTRTIVVLDERVYDLLKKSENDIDEFKIQKLQMKKHFYPNKERFEIPGLYIALPKNLSLSVVQDHLIERTSALREYGFWNKTDYNLFMPKIDRTGNTHSGIAFIYFNGFDETRLDDIVLSRIFINNTKWPGTNQEVHCYWRQTQEGLDKKNDRAPLKVENTSDVVKKDEVSPTSSDDGDTWVTKVKNSLKDKK